MQPKESWLEQFESKSGCSPNTILFIYQIKSSISYDDGNRSTHMSNVVKQSQRKTLLRRRCLKDKGTPK